MELIPSGIRNTNSLRIFKEKIKFWTTDKCPCSLYKTYIGYAGSFYIVLKKRNMLLVVSLHHPFPMIYCTFLTLYVRKLTNKKFTTVS